MKKTIKILVIIILALFLGYLILGALDIWYLNTRHNNISH